MFVELGVLLVGAVLLAGLARLLRLPLIVGYIMTGILAGPFVLNMVSSHDLFTSLSHVGVALLLFIIGLGLHPKVLREIGKTAAAVSTVQIILTTVLGSALGLLLGLDWQTAIYVGIAFSFSSTIIIMKLLADRHEQHRFYGKAALGLLVVQDIVASLMLITITNISSSNFELSTFMVTGAKLLALSLVFIFLARFVLPKISHLLVASQELLFLFSVTWALGAAVAAWELGLSIEIGGLFAGLAFSRLPYAKQMSTKMTPLHDLLLAIFFILLGTQMNFAYLPSVVVPASIFAVVILIGNPIIVMTIMRRLGFGKQTNFRTGLAAAQTGEFGIILIILGFQMGYLSEYIVSLVTLVALLTIIGSSYMIRFSERLYALLEPKLSLFEARGKHNERQKREGVAVLVLGYRENLFTAEGKWRLSEYSDFLVIDKRPAIVEMLHTKNIPVEYGDLRDVEFLDELHLSTAKLVISNILDAEINKLFIEHARRSGFTGRMIVSSKTTQDAIELYNAGSDYVEVFEDTGVKEVARLIRSHGLNKTSYQKERRRHLTELQVF